MRRFIPVLLILFFMNCKEKSNALITIGHRGAMGHETENTLASIKLAWELGADGAECDVMLTADQKVVLFHDNNTKNLCGENFTNVFT